MTWLRSPTARAALISQAKDLITSLQTPQQHVLQLSSDAVSLIALRTIMRIGVLEALPMSGSISLLNLAEATSCQTSLLSRLLRVLVGNRFLSQDGEGGYSHTDISRGYLGQAGVWFTDNLYQPVLEALFQFPLGCMDAETEKLRADGYRFAEPDDTRHNPRVWAWGRGGENIWDIFAKEHPEAMGKFQQGIGMVGDNVPVTGVYDFGKLSAGNDDGERKVLVDVGGGIGQCLCEIVRVHPEIAASRCVLQEQAPLIALASQNPSLPPDILKMPHDFWTLQHIKGAKAYFMRWILHDYSDSAATKILQHIVAAMAPDSRVLISEVVVPERLNEESMLVGTMDMFMLVIGGKERTLGELEVGRVGRVGLRIGRVWSTGGGACRCTVEAVLG
ncbi:O-methyltransferase gsfC [Fulvia fulva]|uniref:O-methyltransferase gsfC n=1 Tax=Passalora fulva TaxID=5499 RepID=A0A9Q8PK95_PASFU|nr:O-methyltransferase gsfC [Fulvia fulva]KAK4612109.1 O-methyltransferase gsfC [Fulvia fulva]UJO23998.1 O-methyltransferase gsfC [Fulvia fulva]